MNSSIQFRRKGPSGEDYLDEVPFTGASSLGFDINGTAVGIPEHQGYTNFGRMPSTSVSATTDLDAIYAATGGSTVAAPVRPDRGGIVLSITSSTNGHGAVVKPATSASTTYSSLAAPVNATSQLRSEVRVMFPSIVGIFGSFGLDENVTDPDPSGTAGDGAMFVFDPGDVGLTVDTGLTAAQHANWILHTKVAGTDAYIATSIPVLASVDYELVIQIGANRKPKFYVNGVLAGTGATALTAGAILSTKVSFELTAAAAKNIQVRSLRLGRNVG